MQNTTEEALKFNRIIDLFECIQKYNTIILVSDYIKNKRRDTNIDFKLNKYRPSIGHWYNIFQEIMLYFKKENITPFIPQFNSFYFTPDGNVSKNKEIIEGIIEIRNKNKGHGITLSTRAYKNLIDELYPLIITLMENLVFLKDYRLIIINSIGYKEDKFIFNTSNCMGPHPEFKKEIINSGIPLPDHQLMLYSTISPEPKFLPLHPYLILIECPECSKEEMFFFEANLDNRKIEYLSYQYGHRLQTEEYNNDFRKIFVNFSIEKKPVISEEEKNITGLPSKPGRFLKNKLIRWLLILFFILFSISILFKYYSSNKAKNQVAETLSSSDSIYLKIYDFSKIYKKLKDKIEKEPQNIMIYYNAGILYEENGWIKAALDQYKKINEIDPNFILARKKIEEISIKIDNFNTMFKDYENYVQSSHKNLNLISEIAYKFFQFGDFPLSIAEYEKILSVTSDNLNCWLNLSLAYTLQGNYSKSIEILKNALVFFPNSERIYFNLGLNYELSGQETTAIENYLQAAKINSNFAPVYYSLADVYNDKNEQAKAVENLNKFLSFSFDREWTEKAQLKLKTLQKSN
ncbi:MAG: hypothetical protein AB1498_12200 [bacterium]